MEEIYLHYISLMVRTVLSKLFWPNYFVRTVPNYFAWISVIDFLHTKMSPELFVNHQDKALGLYKATVASLLNSCGQ